MAADRLARVGLWCGCWVCSCSEREKHIAAEIGAPRESRSLSPLAATPARSLARWLARCLAGGASFSARAHESGGRLFLLFPRSFVALIAFSVSFVCCRLDTIGGSLSALFGVVLVAYGR